MIADQVAPLAQKVGVAMYARFAHWLLVAFLAAHVLAAGDDRAELARWDLVITNGVVLDGTGSPQFHADIAIADGMIAEIGDLKARLSDAARVIDADGMVVTPGFIDAHAHGDPLKTPGFENFLAMGVTTICLGQDGDSPENIAAWMTDVAKARPGTNIAVFIGHGTVRDSAGVGIKENPSQDEIAKMRNLVAEGMLQGALGMTTGLEYQPGSFAKIDELVELAKPVARAGGLVMSHMRSEDDDAIDGALDELLTQGMKSGCPVHVSHIKVTYGHGKARAERLLAKMAEARAAGIKVTADIYPYTASYTGIAIVFPDWAKPPYDYKDVLRERRSELGDYLRRRVAQRNGPSATLFGTEPWVGKTLEQVARELGKPFEDVLMDDIGPRGASAAYFVMDEELQSRLLADDHVMLSSDGRPAMRHPRGYGSFARVIHKFVIQDKLLTLENAIRKMSGLTAETLNLDRRGRIAAGYHADLLIFKPQSVVDNATFDKPHRLASGFDYVIVNGRIVREKGRFNGQRAGMPLKRAS